MDGQQDDVKLQMRLFEIRTEARRTHLKTFMNGEAMLRFKGPCLLVVVAGLMGACSKSPAKSADARTPNEQAVIQRQQTVPECLPIDNAPTTCSNLLPEKWATWHAHGNPSKEELEALVVRLDEINDKLQRENDTQKRNVLHPCTNSDEFDVTYRAPEAMLNFPHDGTGSRFIVAAMFSPNTENMCTEKKFGHRKPSADGGGWIRKYQFLAVNVPSVNLGDLSKDVPVGTWSSYALMQRTVGSTTRYMLKPLEKDKSYYWCAAEHLSRTVQYLTCETQRALMRAVGSNGIKTLDEAFRKYRERDSRILTIIGNAARLVGDEGAWARCGNLGCCVAQ